jgi:hypothetical protein
MVKRMISEKILNKIKCSLCNYCHIVDEPILLECGSNGCLNCIKESSDNQTIQCFCCDREYNRNELLEKPINEKIKNIIKFFLDDLLQDVHRSIFLTKENLNGK